jgi:hypothetical protein
MLMPVRLQTTTLAAGVTQVVEPRPINSLTALGREARIHSDEQIKYIAKSIETFGFREPVLIDAEDRIICGTGRVTAAKLLGLEMVPTIQIADMSEADLRAYRIAANRTAELAKWDREILAIELGELQIQAPTIDITATGFSIPQIEALKFGARQIDEGDDEAPAPAATTVSRIGDLWACGDHRVLCGDALELDSYTRLLEGDAAQCAFLDFPYNCRVQGHITSNSAHGEFVQASGEMSRPEFVSFLTTTLQRVCDALAPGAVIYACMDWRNIELLLAAGGAVGLELLNIAVWTKPAGGMGSFLRSQHELIAIFKKPGAGHINNVELGRNGRTRTNVWSYDGVAGFGAEKAKLRAMHPTCKPVALVKDALLDTTIPDAVVIDSFSGSGTTLIACERIGRQGRVMDLDPHYVDVTVRRWQQLNGRRAVHADSGQSFDQRAQSVAEAPRSPVRTRIRAKA